MFEYENKILKLDDLRPNDYNSNSMEKDIFKKLVNSIKVTGMSKPIVVYEQDNKYIIIDGEHRYKACIKLKLNEVDTRVVHSTHEITPEIAMKIGLELNNIHGMDDDAKLAEIFKHMMTIYDISDLTDTLPFDESEIYDLLDMKMDDIDIDEPSEDIDENDKINIAKLKFELNEEEYEEIWLPAVTKFNKRNKGDFGNREILLGICKAYTDKKERREIN